MGGMDRFIKQNPYIVAALGLIGAGFVAASIQEIGVAMSGLFVQLDWCGQDNSACILAYWALIIIGILVLAIVLNWFHRRKQIKEWLEQESKLKIIPFNGKDSVQRIGIEFQNKTNQNVKIRKVKLIDLIWLKNPRERQSQIEYISKTNRIFKNGHGLDNSYSISNGDNAVIYLAEIQKEQLRFLLEEPKTINSLNWEMRAGENADFETKKHKPFITKGFAEQISIFIVKLDIFIELENSTVVKREYEDWFRFGLLVEYTKRNPDVPETRTYLMIGKQNLIQKGYIPDDTK